MKIRNYISYMFLLLTMSSCTLYMDDEPLRADQMGFTEPLTKTTDYGEIEYQFKDSVYSITDNVLEYIQRVEDDSVLYYLESAPTAYIPKTGFYLSAPASRKIPYGLNSYVLSVENSDGLIKVTSSPCSLENVYQVLNMDLDMPIKFQSVAAMDSLKADSLGLDASKPLIDLSNLPKNDVQGSPSITRGVGDWWNDEGNLWTFYDDELTSGQGYGEISFFNIDTRANASSFVGGLIDEFIHFFPEADALRKSIYVAAKGTLQLNGSMRLTVGLNPLLHIQLQASVEPKLVTSFEMGISGDAAQGALGKKLMSKLATKFKPKKWEPKLPSIQIPIGAVSPAIMIDIEPHFGFGVGLYGFGKISKTSAWDTYNISAGFISNGPALVPVPTEFSIQKSTPNNNADTGVTLSGGAAASLTISGGLGVGVAIAKKAMSAHITNDIEASVGAIVSSSTPSLLNTNMIKNFYPDNYDYSAYSPTDNKLYFNVDDVLGLDFKIRKIYSGSWSVFNDIQNFTYNHELARWCLYNKTWYLRPNVSSITFNKDYGVDKKLSMFDASMKFDDVGMFKSYNQNAVPVLAIRGKSSHKTQMLEPESNGQPTEGMTIKEDKEYTFVFDAEQHFKDPIGYEMAPCIKTADNNIVQINGFEKEIISNLDGAAFIAHEITQSYGAKYTDLNLIEMAKVGAMNITSEEFRNNPGSFYYYEFMAPFELQGGANISKWGVKVTVKNNITSKSTSHTYTVERNGLLSGIKNGKKNVLLRFLSNADPKKSKNSKGPFTVTVEPYFYAKEYPDNKVESEVTSSATLSAAGMRWNDAFDGMKFTSISLK